MSEITVGIPTCDRYSGLALTLMSIATQTLLPKEIIIYDDSKHPQDIRENETLRYILHLFDQKGISWKVLFGKKIGQHHGHQLIQEEAKTPFIFRVDDDEILQSNVLEILSSHMKDGVGAVGGLVLMPGASTEVCKPSKIQDAIENKQYNCQWHFWKDSQDKTAEVEHIYSSYLYRKGVQDFELSLSPVAHREETLHSHGIFKKGYKLIIDNNAVTYHFRSSSGGIRTGKEEWWYNDEITFKEIMNEYAGRKVVFLDSGLGDHLVFKKAVLPKIKEKYKEVILAVCYPEIFSEENCISISEGRNLCNPDKQSISHWMHDHNWKRELKFAYASMYGVTIDE